MTLYHGSSVGDIKELTPFISNHKKPYIYFSTNPVVALLYATRPGPRPFSFYPYGFDGDTVVYSEYYPDAFSDIYKHKSGFLYECDNVPNVKNPTQISCACTCEKPLKVDRFTKIEDLYDQFLDFSLQGKFRIKNYEEISKKELQMAIDDLKNTIFENNLLSNPQYEISNFILKHFSDIWKECQDEITTSAVCNKWRIKGENII